MINLFYKELVGIINFPTRFLEEDSIRKAIAHCREVMSILPDTWDKHIDNAGNLIVYNTKADLAKPMLYLASHIDTVGAKEEDWNTPPFQATETEEYILGRGANDCKAGTAFQLTLARAIAAEQNADYNLGFLIMFREEGNSGKTSSKIDLDTLPVSKEGTYVMVMENTLRLEAGAKYALGVYHREPHNLFITVKGTLTELRSNIDSLLAMNWKPAVITPVTDTEVLLLKEKIQNVSGHIATLKNENNKLLQILGQENGANILMKTGDKKDASVVSPEIFLYEGESEVLHELILNYRNFESMETIRQKLAGIPYTETFGFEHGLGSDQSSYLDASPMLRWLKDTETEFLSIEITDNPGRSDASALFNLLSEEQKEYIIPFACGLGCRTHVDKNGIRHATHGANEGFYKPSAKVTIPALLNFVAHFKSLRY